MNLSYIDYYLPLQKIPLTVLKNNGEIPADDCLIFEKIMGLKTVPRDNYATHINYIVYVLEKFLKKYPAESNAIKYIFIAHTGNEITPFGMSLHHYLAKYFNFNRAHIIGMTLNKCAAAFQAIEISNRLSTALSPTDRIILIIVDISFTNILKTIPGSTVLGDSVTLLSLVKNGNFHHVIDIKISFDGRFSKGVYADYTEKLLFQEIYTDALCDLIHTILQNNCLTTDNLSCIFPHNVNFISWKKIINQLSISEKKVFLDNIPVTAHCFGSDPFINLLSGIQCNRIQPGDYYLLVTVGLGATFAVILMRY